MFKIEVTDEFKKLHKEYFKRIITSRLKNKKIIFESVDIININDRNIQNKHDSFINYCISNAERLAVGNFEELRKIYREIINKYPDIVELIKNKKYKLYNYNKKYWEVLFDVFGYEEFNKSDIYDIIKNMAENLLNIHNTRSKNNKYNIQKKMIAITKEMFPEVAKKIDAEFANISANNIINMDEFYKKFIRFERKNIITVTVEHNKKIESCGVWNAYLFAYESKIRTCPYCNRQYITAVLTSNGKMRATLDHFLPKNIYPYFSMSLYNLVPSCYSCNSSLKGKRDFNVHDINPYYESYDDYVKFVANIPLNEKINIDLVNKKKGNYKYRQVERYINFFKLKNQYNFHINQVEELILKRYMYSEQRIKDMLEKDLKNLNISEKQVKEQIIGYTEDKIKINDEPLSKFRRDIVEQLGLFDDYDFYLENKLKEILNK